MLRPPSDLEESGFEQLTSSKYEPMTENKVQIANLNSGAILPIPVTIN